MGRKHFWFTVTPVEGVDAGTDRWAVEQGDVALTPIRLDLTDERALAKLEAADSANNPAAAS